MLVIVKTSLVFLAVLLLSITINADSYSLIKVKPETKQQFLEMASLGMEIIQATNTEIEAVAEAEDLIFLENAGIPFDFVHANLKEYYKGRNKAALTMGGFRTFSEIVAYIDSITAANPTILTPKWSIGQSIEGRDIWAIKLSDNPGTDESEPEVFYNSLIHAREPAAAASLLHFMEYLVTNYGVDPEITDLVDNRELYFVPVYNPDGYVHNEITDPGGGGMWRKNRRDHGGGEFGIDLNRNYGFEWGYDNLGSSDNISSETYRGTSPFSEPETQAVRDFTISREFVIVHNFHTYSNLELWPYGYNRIFTHEEDFYINLGDSLTQYNGYAPYIGWGLYPTNGAADDWFWGDTISKPRMISLTCEIGSSEDGFWPDPLRIPDLVEENIWPNLYLAQIADNPYAIAPPFPPFITGPDSANSDYQLQWDYNDTINIPVSYDLWEYTDKQAVVDDVESNYGYWESVKMGISSTRAHSGTNSWHTNTQNRAHHWLISNTPYLVKENDSLKFWIWYDIEEDWDFFYAQISVDGGFTYVNLANELTTDYDPYNQNLGNGITGSSGDWVEAKFDISAYEGEFVIFRYAYFTDSWTYEEGVYLDNIANIDLYNTETKIDGGITDQFYNFTEKSSGEYFYRLTSTDIENQESKLSEIYNVIVNPFLLGDVDGSGDINVADLVFLVDYVFKGGPPPEILESGDVNCSSDINVADLTFLVDYLFKGGSAPDC